MNLKKNLDSFLAYFDVSEERLLQVCQIGTLLLLMVFAGSYPYYSTLIKFFAILGILIPRLLITISFWTSLTSVYLAHMIHHSPEMTSDVYMIFFWLLSITCNSYSGNAILSFNAKSILCLSMFFSVLNKIFSPLFISGDLYQIMFLMDFRMDLIRDLLSISDQTEINRLSQGFHWLSKSYLYGEEVLSVPFPQDPKLKPVAIGLMLWTVLIEGVIFIGFGLQLIMKKNTTKWTHLSLLIFIYTTYSLMHVTQLGWLLSLLGLSSTSEASSYRKWYIFGIFFIILSSLRLQYP